MGAPVEAGSSPSVTLPLFALVPICAAVSAVLVGLLTLGFSRAPDGRGLRWFTLVALGGGGFAACDVFMLAQAPDGMVAWMASVQLTFAALHGLGWMLHLAAVEDRALNRVEQALAAVCVVLGAAGLFPGALTSSRLRHHTALGVSWADVEPTPLGFVTYAAFSLGLFYLAVVLYRLWQRGAPVAGATFASALVLALCGANDALVGAGAYPGPYLLTLGFFGTLTAVGVALIRRFLQLSRATEALSRALESKVLARTEELRSAQVALARSEKLAAIGQLAAGVAHEINNPAAVALGNLQFIRDVVAEGGTLPAEGQECIDDSIAALRRVARIVRQLLDAGRAAGSQRGELRRFALAPVVHGTVTMARPGMGALSVEVNVPEDLTAHGDPDLVGQVLLNLLVNAAQATARAGRTTDVEVQAQRHGDLVHLHVIDAGDGMSEQTLARLFEPFFTTRRGVGTGLGLAVSLGLMEVQGGSLEVVATGPTGTMMGLKLPFGAEAGAASADAASAGAASAGAASDGAVPGGALPGGAALGGAALGGSPSASAATRGSPAGATEATTPGAAAPLRF